MADNLTGTKSLPMTLGIQPLGYEQMRAVRVKMLCASCCTRLKLAIVVWRTLGTQDWILQLVKWYTIY